MNYLQRKVFKLPMPDVGKMEAIATELNGGPMEAVPLYNPEYEAEGQIYKRADELFPEELADLMRDPGSVVEALGEMDGKVLIDIVQENAQLYAAVLKYLGPIAFESAVKRARNEKE